MNNRILFLVFLGLLGLYLATKMSGGQKDRSFTAELIKVDTAAVSKILLYPKADNGEELTLERSGNVWTITKAARKELAMNNVVNALLSDITLIKAERVAAKTKAKWSDYELDEAGTKSRIKIFAGTEMLGDFYVGRFKFDPNTRSATSFIRLAEADKVYAVAGFLSMNLGKSFVAFRDRSIVKLQPTEINSLSFSYADNTNANYRLVDQKWMLEGVGAVDSTKIADYLNGLTNLSGLNFKDDFNPVNAIESPERVVLDGPNLETPITVDLYKIADEENPYIANSSINQEAFLQGNVESIYSRLMKGRDAFLLE